MRERLSTMLKEAMKAGDKRRVGTVRLIQSALKDKDIELRPTGKVVGDEDIAAVLRKMVKQRQDSIVIYDQAGRDDLASQEREELAIINEFLPQGMDDAEVRGAVEAAIEERLAARKARDFARADAIRAQLAARGVLLEDGPGGTTWRRG